MAGRSLMSGLGTWEGQERLAWFWVGEEAVPRQRLELKVRRSKFRRFWSTSIFPTTFRRSVSTSTFSASSLIPFERPSIPSPGFRSAGFVRSSRYFLRSPANNVINLRNRSYTYFPLNFHLTSCFCFVLLKWEKKLYSTILLGKE